MKVRMILPALTEAISPYWRSIKYSLFPPLGLATLAGYLGEDDEVSITDEHVEAVDTDDRPDLVAIEVYITSAYRAYQLADIYRSKGVHVALGGLHVTALPEEAAIHADTIFVGPGEDTWPAFLADFRAGRPGKVYKSTTRTLAGMPPVRRDLIKRNRYLTPNSIVVSRGCPHNCDFCYKQSFFAGGRSFYTKPVDDALAEIEALPGRHLFFLDDNLFGSRPFAEALFDGMRGMGRVWQAAATVRAVMEPCLLEKAVECGLRSLFIGFETLSTANLREQGKYQNLGSDYGTAIRRLRDMGVMINGSFVFGLDDDDETTFDRTVEWAVGQGIETATFHILTPYPGTALHQRMSREGRITSCDWNLYDTRHAVYAPANMSAEALEGGYWRAYREFYRWSSILKGAWAKETLSGRLRHATYAGGWKKLEPMWDWVIRAGLLPMFKPLLEAVLDRTPRRCALGQDCKSRPNTGTKVGISTIESTLGEGKRDVA
jgi:radical SAM superfamily enzyme YgiQ (UPF0313 family)